MTERNFKGKKVFFFYVKAAVHQWLRITQKKQHFFADFIIKLVHCWENWVAKRKVTRNCDVIYFEVIFWVTIHHLATNNL